MYKSFHTVLLCSKWESCVSFYRDVLGLRSVEARDGFVEVEVVEGSFIGLIRSPGDSTSEACSTPVILSFRVDNTDELHAILSKQHRGIGAVRLHPWGVRLFEMRDPEGRRLEFWTPQTPGA